MGGCGLAMATVCRRKEEKEGSSRALPLLPTARGQVCPPARPPCSCIAVCLDVGASSKVLPVAACPHRPDLCCLPMQRRRDRIRRKATAGDPPWQALAAATACHKGDPSIQCDYRCKEGIAHERRRWRRRERLLVQTKKRGTCASSIRIQK